MSYPCALTEIRTTCPEPESGGFGFAEMHPYPAKFAWTGMPPAFGFFGTVSQPVTGRGPKHGILTA